MANIKLEFTGTLDTSQPIVITDSNGTHTFRKESAPPPPPPPPPPTDGIDYWKGDAETGDLSQWAKQAAVPGRITVVTNPVHRGNYAYRFELRDGDNSSGERCQLDSGISGGANAHYIKNGEEAYYGVSIYLPSSMAKVDKWRQFTQFKGIHTGSPPLQIGHNGSNWRIYYRPNTSSSNLLKWQAPDRRDVWERFTFHIKWSTDPKIGFFEMKYNDTLVIPKFYTSLIHVEGGEVRDNIVDIGIYRDSGISTTDIVYIDHFLVGRSWEEVS